MEPVSDTTSTINWSKRRFMYLSSKRWTSAYLWCLSFCLMRKELKCQSSMIHLQNRLSSFSIAALKTQRSKRSSLDGLQHCRRNAVPNSRSLEPSTRPRSARRLEKKRIQGASMRVPLEFRFRVRWPVRMGFVNHEKSVYAIPRLRKRLLGRLPTWLRVVPLIKSRLLLTRGRWKPFAASWIAEMLR